MSDVNHITYHTLTHNQQWPLLASSWQHAGEVSSPRANIEQTGLRGSCTYEPMHWSCTISFWKTANQKQLPMIYQNLWVIVFQFLPLFLLYLQKQLHNFCCILHKLQRGRGWLAWKALLTITLSLPTASPIKLIHSIVFPLSNRFSFCTLLATKYFNNGMNRS